MLQPLYGGALARPFTTHHNALDRDLYLRIATELYLKRLIVGGIDRVYELGKDFRNEGVSFKHNPEFTMLEWYEAYADYEDAAERLERLVARVAEAVLGTTEGRARRGRDRPRAAVAAGDAARGDPRAHRDRRRSSTRPARRSRRRWTPRPSPEEGWGKLVDGLLSKEVEPQLIQPTFILDYPVEMSPFAKRHRSEEGLVERWEAYVGGFEIANAFTELNDPDEQRRRFEQQAEELRRGDEEAQPFDESYVAGARVRDAADRRRRARHRPPGDAAHRRQEPARGGPVPGDAELSCAGARACCCCALGARAHAVADPVPAARPMRRTAPAPAARSSTSRRSTPTATATPTSSSLSREGVTAPGISVIDVARDLRPKPLPGVGDTLSAAGPVYRGSYGQRQIQATEVRVLARSDGEGRPSRRCRNFAAHAGFAVRDPEGSPIGPDILATRRSRQPEVLIRRQPAAEEVDQSPGAVASPGTVRT